MRSILILLLITAAAFPQDRVKGIAGTATLEETGKWLVDNFAKYSEYKTPGREFEVSKVKFAACKLSYTSITRFGSSGTDTMGTTVRRSNSKRDIVLDLATLDPSRITTADHLYPDLKYLRLAKLSSAADPVELSVKLDASDAMRAAFARAITLCKPN